MARLLCINIGRKSSVSSRQANSIPLCAFAISSDTCPTSEYIRRSQHDHTQSTSRSSLVIPVRIFIYVTSIPVSRTLLSKTCPNFMLHLTDVKPVLRKCLLRPNSHHHRAKGVQHRRGLITGPRRPH